MKKKITGFLLLLFCIFLAGCGGMQNKENAEATNKNQAAGGKKNIALVMKTLTNPFFVEMENGARRAEKELNVNLIVKTGAKETSVDQQISIIEELIRDKVDAIVIAPASSTELIPVLKKAQDAKIPIVNIDNQLDAVVAQKLGLAVVPFISVDNEKGAYLSAKYISDKITAPTDVVVLEGIREAKNAQDRLNGALRAFKENKNITVVATDTAHWKIDEAYEVTDGLYKKYPNIGAFFCANDMMALGALKYLEEKGKKNVLVAGYDALDEAKKAVEKGTLAATIDQQAAEQGYLGMKTALQLIRGEAAPPLTLVEVKVVTAGK